MTTFVLILYFYAGMLARGDSIGIVTQEFTTEARCQEARKATANFVSGTTKSVESVCVPK